jgi:hypothetical protein
MLARCAARVLAPVQETASQAAAARAAAASGSALDGSFVKKYILCIF